MNSNTESYESIDALLHNTIPRASDAFEKRLEENLLAQFDATFKPGNERRGLFFNLQRPRAWAIGSTVLLILVMTILIVPSTRIAAKELLLGFTRAISEVISVDFRVVSPDDENQVDASDFEVATVADASAKAGFQVKAPEFLPGGFYLVRIAAGEGWGFLWYERSGYGYISINQYDPQKTYLVTECASVEVEGSRTVEGEEIVDEEIESQTEAVTDSCGDLAGIGVDAEIIDIQIGDVVGKFVKGGWEAIPNEVDMQAANPGETVTSEFVWNSDWPEYQLSWSEDGIAFAVDVFAPGITTDEIIALANSFK